VTIVDHLQASMDKMDRIKKNQNNPAGYALERVRGLIAAFERKIGEDAEVGKAACDAYRKLGLQKLKGILVHELVVFTGNKRIDFGGYADSESTNLSVATLPNSTFKIVESYFHDGEGGARVTQEDISTEGHRWRGEA
jgi:hypothetical protein